MPLKYLTGDATTPQGAGSKVIPHLCNDIGAWGAGFVLAVSKKWPAAEAEYKRVYQSQGNKLTLGTVQFVQVQSAPGDSIWIANMIAQRNIRKLKGTLDECPPIRYPALFDCLDEVGKFAALNNATIHAPRFGAGLAGGRWEIIESMIQTLLVATHGRDVTVYDWVVAPAAGIAPAAPAAGSSGTDALD